MHQCKVAKKVTRKHAILFGLNVYYYSSFLSCRGDSEAEACSLSAVVEVLGSDTLVSLVSLDVAELTFFGFRGGLLALSTAS